MICRLKDAFMFKKEIKNKLEELHHNNLTFLWLNWQQTVCLHMKQKLSTIYLELYFCPTDDDPMLTQILVLLLASTSF